MVWRTSASIIKNTPIGYVTRHADKHSSSIDYMRPAGNYSGCACHGGAWEGEGRWWKFRRAASNVLWEGGFLMRAI
jgi:hypothetical protein